MSYELLIALAAFAFVSSISPGPNNLMLMSSGANFGFKKTIPHLFGVGLGFVFMILLVGIGVMKVFDVYPVSYDILKVVSIAYLVYLGVKIALSDTAVSKSENQSKPLTFIQAAAFQWVNPKAWTMALTAISVYAPSQSLAAVMVVAVVFGVINLPCIYSWIVVGEKVKVFLNNPARLRIFNFVMAFLLLLSLLPALK